MKKFLLTLVMSIILGENAMAESLTKEQQSIALVSAYMALGN